MKVCLVQNSFGDYQLRTFDKRNYLAYLPHLSRFDPLYLHSYTNLRSKRKLASQRIVTIKTKGSSGEAITANELTLGHVDRLCCILFVDSKVLRFEQWLSFQPSRK